VLSVTSVVKQAPDPFRTYAGNMSQQTQNSRQEASYLPMDPIRSFLPFLSEWGIPGILGMTALERFIPILPSYGLFVTVGIVVSEGRWMLPAALLTSVAGSMIGCTAYYAAGRAIGKDRFLALLFGLARLGGVAPVTVRRWVVYLRRRQATFSFVAQLVPAVRLLAPGIAGLLRVEPKTFLLATTPGVAIWNSLFIMIGYKANATTGAPNLSSLTLTILVLLIAANAVILLAWQGFTLRQRQLRARANQRQ
jgi:membrane protein DedA with SNARE-associated domain